MVKAFEIPSLNWDMIAPDRWIAAGPEGDEHYTVFSESNTVWCGLRFSDRQYLKTTKSIDEGKKECQDDCSQRASFRPSSFMNLEK